MDSGNLQDNNKERQAGMVRNNMTLEDSISFQLYTEIIEIFARNYFSYVFNAKRFMQFIPMQLSVKKISKLESFSYQLQKFGLNLVLKELNDSLSPLQ